MRYFRSLLLALLVIAPSVVFAQPAKQFVVDLADQKPGSTRTEAVDAGETFGILIANRTTLPYDISVQKIPVVVSPLTFPQPAAPSTTCPSETFKQDFAAKKS